MGTVWTNINHILSRHQAQIDSAWRRRFLKGSDMLRQLLQWFRKEGRPAFVLELFTGLSITVVAQVTAQEPLAAPPLATATAPLVVRGATVIDVRNGQRLADRTVVVVEHRIQSVTPTAQTVLPPGATVVEAQGKYLIPGLWDMHVHPDQYVDIAYPLFIANGVTGVRDAGSYVPLVTLGQWKQEIAEGIRVGPRVLVSGPQVLEDDTGNKVAWPSGPPSRHLNVPPVLAVAVIDSLRAAGADFIKTYTPMSRAMYFAIAAEARRIGIPFGGHLPTGSVEIANGLGNLGKSDMFAVDGLTASDSGATFLDHETYLLPDVCGDAGIAGHDTSSVACMAAAQHLRRNHSWITILSQVALNPTGSRADFLARFKDRVHRYVPASFGNSNFLEEHPAMGTGPADWKNPAQTQFARLHEAGMPLLVGTDMTFMQKGNGILAAMVLFTPGFVLHDALEGLVCSGLTPLEALQTATLNPALALGAVDSLGTIEVGKVADLVLLDADPLVNITNTTQIQAVVANGRYYDRTVLDELLVQAEAAAARQ